MKVTAFNGSPRSDGNTRMMIDRVLAKLSAAGIDTECVDLPGKPFRGCTACYQCFQRQDGRCAVGGDFVNDCIAKMLDSDGILLATPTYFADVSAEMKALIDRAGLVAKANGDLFARKVGAGIAAVRRGGAVHAFDTMNHFFLIGQMIVTGSVYWNLGVGLDKGDVANDEEGIKTMDVLGENMAWVLKKLA